MAVEFFYCIWNYFAAAAAACGVGKRESNEKSWRRRRGCPPTPLALHTAPAVEDWPYIFAWQRITQQSTVSLPAESLKCERREPMKSGSWVE